MRLATTVVVKYCKLKCVAILHWQAVPKFRASRLGRRHAHVVLLAETEGLRNSAHMMPALAALLQKDLTHCAARAMTGPTVSGWKGEDGSINLFRRSYPVGTCVAKLFAGVLHSGHVVWRRTPYHRIRYTDGDTEDLDVSEMAASVGLFERCVTEMAEKGWFVF